MVLISPIIYIYIYIYISHIELKCFNFNQHEIYSKKFNNDRNIYKSQLNIFYLLCVWPHVNNVSKKEC